MLIGPQNLAASVREIRFRITRAAEAASRDPASITLIAVGKAQPAENLRAAATAGVTNFGESYLQEALPKIEQLGGLDLRWHFIGAVQSNKTRAVAAHFDWVHSIDRLEIARRLAAQRPAHAPALNLCIQVALVAESTKGGVDPLALTETAVQIAKLPHIRLRGLMCVPPPQRNSASQRHLFARLRSLLDELNAGGLKLDTLSMGMSGDFEAAIAEGATHVRIGTALFGAR